MLKPGTAAPSFEAKVHSGDLFCLADMRNEYRLVLDFYQKNFTYGCT